MKKLLLILSIFLLLFCAACGDSVSDPTDVTDPIITDGPASPEPTVSVTEPVVTEPAVTEPAYTGALNPLTGMPIDEKYVNSRPIAVMLNNLKKALPQHGVSQADIIYEVPVEGGITRMLGVYQSVENVGWIGSVRSSRTCFLELALGHDAVYLHAGGSPDAYNKISAWSVTALDCVNGSYEGTLYWRDKDRIKNAGFEHSVFTSGEKILKYFPTYSFRKEHKDNYAYEMGFVDDGTPAAGETAQTITVRYSDYKTGVFSYDAEKKLYMITEYKKPYIDGNSGDQVGVTNVIIIKTSVKRIAGDTAGRLDVDLISGGEGWYANGGKLVPITWSKADRNSQFIYTAEDGTPLVLGRGATYVNIIPLANDISYE